MKSIKRFKFLREGLQSESGSYQWKVGKWEKIAGELVMCENGFHCSKEPYDAFSYVQGEILALVEVRGKHESDYNKEVWEEMRIVKTYAWTKTQSVELAIFSAEQVIDIYEKEYPNEDRPRKAIEAAKEYLKNPNEKNSAAARAASAAARAANVAAWAASDAAWAAASDAAWAASDAASAAASAAARAANVAANVAASAAARAANVAANVAASAAARAASAASDAAWAASAASDAAWAASDASDAAWAAMIKRIQKKFKKMVSELEEIK